MSGYTAIAEEVLSTTSLKTILQITNPNTNPASHRIAVYGVRISGAGTNSIAEPARVLVGRQTTAGTGGVALTAGFGPVPLDPAMPASSITAVKGPAGAWTTEPTLTDVIMAQKIHPQTGMGEFIPLNDEPRVAPNGRLAVLVVATISVAITAQFYWREGH
ncbi:hypothetical protein ACGFIV_00995 [Sphaerisporangium sp. NPDC049003]|uniref:hypothetical protein n=1 Tax=Sphaerisporangium sp. NPDC049003 TaxID=3364517 RepID=UPI00371F8B9D